MTRSLMRPKNTSLNYSKVASHAYHLVCLAQEKAETQDKIDEVLKRLATEETELEGLQSAVAIMKNSNVNYRDGQNGVLEVA